MAAPRRRPQGARPPAIPDCETGWYLMTKSMFYSSILIPTSWPATVLRALPVSSRIVTNVQSATRSCYGRVAQRKHAPHRERARLPQARTSKHTASTCSNDSQLHPQLQWQHHNLLHRQGIQPRRLQAPRLSKRHRPRAASNRHILTLAWANVAGRADEQGGHSAGRGRSHREREDPS